MPVVQAFLGGWGFLCGWKAGAGAGAGSPGELAACEGCDATRFVVLCVECWAGAAVGLCGYLLVLLPPCGGSNPRQCPLDYIVVSFLLVSSSSFFLQWCKDEKIGNICRNV